MCIRGERERKDKRERIPSVIGWMGILKNFKQALKREKKLRKNSLSLSFSVSLSLSRTHSSEQVRMCVCERERERTGS